MAPRRMVVVDANVGLVEVEIRSDDTASTIALHHAAIGYYLATGDDSRLSPLTGTRLDLEGETYELETRPWRIEDLALAGDLGYDDIYVLE